MIPNAVGGLMGYKNLVQIFNCASPLGWTKVWCELLYSADCWLQAPEDAGLIRSLNVPWVYSHLLMMMRLRHPIFNSSLQSHLGHAILPSGRILSRRYKQCLHYDGKYSLSWRLYYSFSLESWLVHSIINLKNWILLSSYLISGMVKCFKFTMHIKEDVPHEQYYMTRIIRTIILIFGIIMMEVLIISSKMIWRIVSS